MTSLFSLNLFRLVMALLPAPAKCCGRHRGRPGGRCLNCPVKRAGGAFGGVKRV
jgi:hypothetical protein